ncbi:MAG: hypothetical protein K0B37_16780 [Bacteroidales bacterium]|nr:hypothetical protein [Bacteroidales bacterium]
MKSFNDNNKRNISRLLEYILSPGVQVLSNNRKRITDALLWSATTDRDDVDSHKYRLPIWTSHAVEYRKEWLCNGRKGLRHEHMYPRNLLRKRLDLLASHANATPDAIYDLLLKFSHGAIVHMDEAALLNRSRLARDLPHPYNKNEDADPVELLFSRYIHLKIDLKFIDFQGDEIIDENIYYLKDGVLNWDVIRALDFDGWDWR